MEIKKIEMGKLRPAKYNPRVELKPGDAEYEKLKRSIVDLGLLNLLFGINARAMSWAVIKGFRSARPGRNDG